jgi:hypothetical protein
LSQARTPKSKLCGGRKNDETTEKTKRTKTKIKNKTKGMKL